MRLWVIRSSLAAAYAVQITDGLIYRNEVYFDMLPLITAIRHWNVGKAGANGRVTGPT